MAKEEKKVLLHIENMKQYFPIKKSSIFQKEQLYVRANDGISLDIYEGETVGLVGESGCGKSTFGRSILQLYHQTDGKTIYYGTTIEDMAPKYVEEELTSLSRKKKLLEILQNKEKEAEEKAASAAEGSDKYMALDRLANARKAARDTFLDMVSLIGGLFVADDLDTVGRKVLAQHKAAVALKKAQRENKDTEALQKAFDAASKEVQDLADQYKSNPKFEEYQAYYSKGVDLTRLTNEESRHLRKDLQLIFQDPYSSLNPRMTVGQIIGEGLLAHKYFEKNNEEMQEYVLKVMDECGLAPYFIHRYPHQFSGGQRQRIGIARSLALRPKFVVCDEAVSALDVSIQSQIINLLLDLKEKNNLTYLFISHDLSVIKYISDRVGVMYLGNLVELADTEELYAHPTHPYTEALLSAIPTTDLDDDKESIVLEGDIPSPIRPPKGCKFHTRCQYCTDICKNVVPEWEEIAPGHFVACHHKRGM